MINILFGGNYKVFDGILLCLLSMKNKTNKPLNVFVMTTDLQDLNKDYIPINNKQIQLLNNIVKTANPQSKV